MNACLKELASRDGVELLVSHEVPDSQAPFDDGQFAWIQNRISWRTYSDLAELDSVLGKFAPEILVIPSWHVHPYRRVARQLSRRCLRVMAMDNPWLGSLKQRLGTIVSPFWVKPIADLVWLPGERQAAFARRLGFAQNAILRGLYTCDHSAFAAKHNERIAQGLPVPRRFAFVGRMVAEKNIRILAEAYNLYRSQSIEPWPLICCGSGPLRSCLENQEGIQLEGFVQPESMPQTLNSVGCLILPSNFEPWALVVHEATSAGKLILASENVGAVPHLVQPGYNGFIFDRSDVAGLARLMSRISSMNDAQLDQMSRASHLLSYQFSPKQWADTLLYSYDSNGPRSRTPGERAFTSVEPAA
jgi:glycosyltransferase involved in cell wall biosynthesis